MSIKIGPTSYGTVACCGHTTDYKDVPEGNHSLTGDVTGYVLISGRGKHEWTLTISSSGTFSIKED